jgi:hypothetical protein
MKYNPDEYETVKERKARLRKDFSDARIEVELLSPAEKVAESVLIRAVVYTSAEDQEKGLPRGVGIAYEERDTELSVSSSGKQYESVNYTSWTENCEESAVGRALDNAGYSGNKKCSRDEMEKAGRMAKVSGDKASGKQIKYLRSLVVEGEGEEFEQWLSKFGIASEAGITKGFASKAISKLTGKE